MCSLGRCDNIRGYQQQKENVVVQFFQLWDSVSRVVISFDFPFSCFVRLGNVLLNSFFIFNNDT